MYVYVGVFDNRKASQGGSKQRTRLIKICQHQINVQTQLQTNVL